MANEETTRSMQEALQGAVARMNNGGSVEPKIGLSDVIGPLMAVLSPLLQNRGKEEMLERLDTLQKGDLTTLREQVDILRKQCHRMLKFQEQLLLKVHEIQKQQVAAAGAVLDLAQQMARITFIDDPSAGEDDEERNVPPAPLNYRAGSRTSNRNGNGRRHRET
jgi:polyhydroxyalkanoate synthesis regulator phasin